MRSSGSGSPGAMRAVLLAVLVVTLAPRGASEAGCSGADRGAGTCPSARYSRDLALVQKRTRLAQQTSFDMEMQGRALDTNYMTVLCWNVMWTNFGAPEHIRRQLADVMVDTMKADVAGLQECMSEDAMQYSLGDRMKKAPMTDQFNCIFYKPGVVEFLGISGRTHLGDYATGAYSARFASHAKLSFEGKEFWLFSTHWCLHGACSGPEGGLKHKHSAQVILRKREELGAGDKPTIICADANSMMDGYDEDDGVQWFLTNGFEIAAKGPSFGGIDYIFVSKGHWTIGRATVGPTAPSDHASFTVKLAIAGPGGVTHTEEGGDWYRLALPPIQVGGFGGICTCPSGEQYNVGDLWDGCANGPASLACEGGTPGECVKKEDPQRKGMMVTCDPNLGPSPADGGPTAEPTLAPKAEDPAPAPAPAEDPDDPILDPPPSAEVEDHYRKVPGIGAWGGTCTCPSGKSYNVGDLFDACANGPQSLACEGGTPGECFKVVDPERDGMKVTCGAKADAPVDNYRKVAGVGGWGGICTCPSGKEYNVGDLYDGCANGPESLACEGGTPGECVKAVDPAREGMKVTCA